MSAVAAWVLALSGAAVASPNFPDVVQKVSGSNCAPTCLLCHSTNPGRAGTAVGGTAFGKAVAIHGGVAASGKGDALIRDVLLKMKNGDPTTTPPTPPSDVDGDGISDFTELGLSMNPNPGNADLCEIAYGCGAHIAPAPPPSRLALCSSALVALGLVWMGARVRRGRR